MTTWRGWCCGFRLAFWGLAWTGLTAGSAPAVDETLVASNAACRYKVPTNGSLGTNWTARTFSDSSWGTGHSGLGYDNETTYTALFGTTVPNNTIVIYSRFAFQIPAGKTYSSLKLRVKYDDGFIAYLNGVEVARANAPAGATYNTPASALHDDTLAIVYQDYDISSFVPQLTIGTNMLAVHALNVQGSSDLLILPELVAGLPEVVTNIVINEFMADNSTTLTNSFGKHEDWIELYNPFTTNVSLSGWYLTDDAAKLTKWKFPTNSISVIAGKGYLLVWADNLDKAYSVTNNELHTSFSLNKDGEYLALVKPDGVTVVSAYAPLPQYQDSSYGIGLTGEYRYFAVPTPGAVNAFSGPSNEVAGVKFSPKRGVFTNAVPPVTVTTATAGAEIRYTTNAEPPTASSPLYTTPFVPANTAVIRAAAFKTGFAPSGIDTHSFIVVGDVLSQPAAPAGWPTSWAGYTADYGMDQTIVANARTALTNALISLPSLSLVTPQANLFDSATGLYVNPEQTGDEWERGTSAEWINTDNTSLFQIDCGLRIQGAYFRQLGASLKKSFTLRFRTEYGEGSLVEDLFSGNAVGSFNDLVLRAGANDGWNMWGQAQTQYLVDEFMRRTHLAMGGVSPHGTFVHLYLNGLYWGLYNVTEKISGEFAAAYCGGRDDTWDVRSQDGTPLEGDFTAWDAMLNVLDTNPGSNETYQRVQGNNPDGTRNPAYPVYLDVGNYIDYMLLQYWSANWDWPWNNWRAFRDRNDSVSTGFKFAVWDAEVAFGLGGDPAIDTTGSSDGVAVIQSKLASNAEYQLRFADRVQKYLFNGGELTPAVLVPRYQELAAQIEPAIVAESARWGDQDGNASHTVEEWRSQRDYLLNTFLTQRGATALQYLTNRGLYPTVAAPVFSRFGGLFTNSLNLAVTAEQPVYYTLDGSDPRHYGTGAVVGTLYTTGVALTRTTRVKARARTAAGAWSALTEAVFTLAEMPALRVTELMYHPRPPASVSGESYLDGDDEFIELQNAGSAPIGLAGLRFTQGVSFDFTSGAVPVLNPGEYVLVVKNIAAFTNRYPSVPPQRIAGAFAFPATSLDDAGEKIEIQDAVGRTVVSFTYNNSWLVATDGAGHSLVPVSGVAQADGELDYPGNWRASVYIGGSPGQAEPAAPATSLVLNEILAHTDTNSPPYDSNDGIELYNTTAQPITLGPGWYLSDDPEDLTKWAIPATNTIAAHGWRYFDEMHDFHAPLTNGFGLNKAGEQVLLSYLPGTGLDRVVDAVSFKGQENGVPLVRYPDGAASWFYGVFTPGASNQLVAAGMVIAEVMYHPQPTAANPENNENDEYVELYNPTAQPITLMNLVADVGVWRLAGGIAYLFPTNTVVPAGGRLVVVPFDPVSDLVACEAFLSAYGLTNGQIRILGPYAGHLNNKTDAVRLERPVNPDVAGETVSWHVIDQVTYYDAAPWPAEADGTGRPLTRLPGQNSGDDPASWVAGLSATPGQGPAKVAVMAPAANTGYLVPASMAVTAAVDPAFVVGTVSQVVLVLDGVDVASFSAAPYTNAIALDAREGVRRLMARLTDGAGAYTSAVVPIVVYTNIPALTVGTNQTVELSVTNRVSLHAAADIRSWMTNIVRFVWSCPGDSSVVVENPTQADAAACFTQPGQYELMVTMFICDQPVSNRFVTVTVTPAFGYTGPGGVTNGLALWLDASQLTGLTDGQPVNTWTDMSGLSNNAVRQSGSSAGYPQYATNVIGGKAVVRFNSANGNTGDYFKFNRISTIRTVFWVVKENAGASDGHFLLGDDSSYDFHRQENVGNGRIWDSGYINDNIRNGTTKLMGTVTNGTTTAIPPNQFQLISLVTVGNVQANQVTQDRSYHGSWQGNIAEIIIYTNALTSDQEIAVGSYLADKYGLLTAYPPLESQTLPAVINVAMGNRGAYSMADVYAFDYKQSATAGTAAPLAYGGHTWNQSNGGASLKDSKGGSTTVGFTISQYKDGPGDWGGPGKLQLFGAGMHADGGHSGGWQPDPGTFPTVMISGLTNSHTYDLYLATYDGGGCWNTFTVGGTIDATNPANPLIVGGTTLTADNSAGNAATWVENQNYVHFAALVPNASGTITVLENTLSGRYCLNGFQLRDLGPTTPPPTPPTALFTATPTNDWAPLTVYFTDSSTNGSGAITNSHWGFGDGHTHDNTTRASVTNAYAGTGTYTVVLIVSDDNGLANTNSALINVTQRPPLMSPIMQSDQSGFYRDPEGRATVKFTNAQYRVQYTLEYKDDLRATNNWQPCSLPTSGLGAITLQDTNATEGVTQRFYRIEAHHLPYP